MHAYFKEQYPHCFKQKGNLTIGCNIQILSGRMYRISKNIWISAKAQRDMSDKIDMKNGANWLGQKILLNFVLVCWFKFMYLFIHLSFYSFIFITYMEFVWPREK